MLAILVAFTFTVSAGVNLAVSSDSSATEVEVQTFFSSCLFSTNSPLFYVTMCELKSVRVVCDVHDSDFTVATCDLAGETEQECEEVQVRQHHSK